MKPTLLFLIHLLVVLPATLFAQNQPYSIVHYTTDHGLPQNSITTLSFDQWGYCWLGTEMGVVRFDGKRFKVFNSGNIPGFHSDRIRLSTIDTAGKVYIRSDKMEHLLIEANSPGAAPYPRLEKDPFIWMPTISGYATQSPIMMKWAMEKINRASGSDRSAYPSFNLQEGGIYCIEEDTLYYLRNKALIPIDTLDTDEGLKRLAVGNLFLVLEKNGCVKAWKNGLLQRQIIKIRGPLQQSRAYQTGKFHFFSYRNQSYIYADNTLYGIHTNEKDEVDSKVLLENIDIPVLSLVYYHAAQRKYYIGSLVSGLYVVSISDFSYLNKPSEAIDDGVYSQVTTKEGDIVCQQYLYQKGRPIEKLPLNKYVGATLYMSPQQQLYYGNDPRLYRFDMATRESRKLMDLDSRPSSLYRDKTDSTVIILSTTHAMGKLVNDSLASLKKLPGENVIMSTLQTGKDSFLVATQAGVKWYDFVHNSIYHSVLDSLYIRSVYPEANGRVWISTFGKGFFLYDKGKIHPLPVHPFKALEMIHAFVDDGRGNFWLPTNNGLYKVKKEALLAYANGTVKEVYYYAYSVTDNLRTNEFNGGCTPGYLWLKDSLLSLPSIEGLVQFYPHSMLPVLPGNKIFADEIRINNTVIGIPGEEGLVLNPDYGRLTIAVNSPYFGNKENLQLVYRLEGLEKDWQPVPENGEILFTRMPAGSYSLVVQKLTGQGINDYASLTIPVTVKPWFYNTWWFYCLVFFILCGVLFLLIWIRTRILKERNKALQEIVTTQTADLSKTVEQLKRSEQALVESNQMKDKVTTMVLHDLRSPIRFLHTISNRLVKKHDTMPAEEITHNLSLLRSSTGSLNDFTEQFFTWAASQHQDFKVSMDHFSLQVFFEDLEELYTDIATIHNNQLEIIPANLVLHTDRNILAAIIRNLVDNANKNTHNGTITLSAKTHPDKVVLSVTDTGTGLSPAMVQAFHDEHKQSGATRNGSTIVMSLLEKIGGTLSIETEQGKGTTFNVGLNHH